MCLRWRACVFFSLEKGIDCVCVVRCIVVNFLSHRYLGVVRGTSSIPDINLVPKAKDKAVYQWFFCAGGVQAEEQVILRCNHVKDQGVPLPRGWQVAFRALLLPKIAQRSAAKASVEAGHGSLECKVLGVAQPLPTLTVSSPEAQVGSLMVLSAHGGGRSPVVLCAHVQGMQWLCYLFCDGDAMDAIDSVHLVLDDVDTATKLDPTEEEIDKMVKLVHGNESSFSKLFAEAAWRAEEHRASLRGASFDAGAASVGYEADPFLWQHGSKAHVCIVWTLAGSADSSLAAGEEMVPSKFRWHRLDDALSKGWSFPAPRFNAVPPLKAEELRYILEGKAAYTEKNTLCPCGYLGCLVRGDAFAATSTFEPDPAKWPVSALEAAGGNVSKIYVWYEWKYITVGPTKKPHRVRMRVDNAIEGTMWMSLVPQLDTGCMWFSGPQGDYALTGKEVLRGLRCMEFCGPAKYSAASALLYHLQHRTSTCDDAYGDTPEKQKAGKAYVQEVMAELEAIASMSMVDAFIDGTEGFIACAGSRDMETVTVWLRGQLQKFLSVNSWEESKLRECYSAVDAALEAFQHALAHNKTDAAEQLARAMDGLSTRSSHPGP